MLQTQWKLISHGLACTIESVSVTLSQHIHLNYRKAFTVKAKLFPKVFYYTNSRSNIKTHLKSLVTNTIIQENTMHLKVKVGVQL